MYDYFLTSFWFRNWSSNSKSRSELLDESFESIQKTPILAELDSYFAQGATLLKYQVITKIQGRDAGLSFLLENQAGSCYLFLLLSNFLTTLSKSEM